MTNESRIDGERGDPLAEDDGPPPPSEANAATAKAELTPALAARLGVPRGPVKVPVKRWTSPGPATFEPASAAGRARRPTPEPESASASPEPEPEPGAPIRVPRMDSSDLPPVPDFGIGARKDTGPFATVSPSALPAMARPSAAPSPSVPRQASPAEPIASPELESIASPSSGFPTWAGAAVGVIALVAVGGWLATRSGDSATPASAAAATPAIAPKAPERQRPSSSEAAAKDTPGKATKTGTPERRTLQPSVLHLEELRPLDLLARRTYTDAQKQYAADRDQDALARMVTAACGLDDVVAARSAFRKLKDRAARISTKATCRTFGVDVTLKVRTPTAADLLRKAKRAALAGEAKTSHDAAKESNKLERSGEAMLLMARASCDLKDMGRAKRLRRMVTSEHQAELISYCNSVGIELPPRQ